MRLNANGQDMQRRTLLKAAAFAGLAGQPASRLFGFAPYLPSEPGRVHTVLLVTKCHLDVGFTLTQAKVMREYFDVYFPAAIQRASMLRAMGTDHYTWTTGSWLLYEYLEQANPEQRRAMENAIAAGDIAWHGLPFSWQTEMVDRSMIEGALSFSRSLDQRFGRETIGAKMTDVPGHSRGIVTPLSDGGIRFLDIGVNAASTPPQVPDVFLWKEPMGKSLAVMYHRHDYGSVLEVPGSGIAVDVEVRGDNSGPHSMKEIGEIYAKLRNQFPGARIQAATLSDVAAAVDRVRNSLPVVTSEIGDTWIYGCASDPVKVSRYRSVTRMRKNWLADAKFTVGDLTDRNLLRHLLLAAEHTWGTDTKSYLDDDHYQPAILQRVLDKPGYVVMEESWKEKRSDIDRGVSSLPEDLQQQAARDMNALLPVVPDTGSLSTHNIDSPVETRHFTIQFDLATGAIVRLRSQKTGIEWASAENPLALLTYQTLAQPEYTAFMRRYITVDTDWAPKDFGKPGIDKFGATAREWHPQVLRCLSGRSYSEDRVVLELAFQDAAAEATGNIAWPKHIFMELRFPVETPELHLSIVCLGKVQNRMPEALWLSFRPNHLLPASWQVEKVGQMVAATDVVQGGGRAMHAVNERVSCSTTGKERFELKTLDAPVIGFGDRSPLNFSKQMPDFATGAHVSLFNNCWGTNYPQWNGGDWLYRFQLFA